MVFRVGQKVVCIDADGSPALSLDAIYTIKKIGRGGLRWWRGRLRNAQDVWLIEANPRGGNYSFAPERFRPVVETKTDISIFQKMLTPKKDKSKDKSNVV